MVSLWPRELLDPKSNIYLLDFLKKLQDVLLTMAYLNILSVSLLQLLNIIRKAIATLVVVILFI